jgi:membrane peptidoglycan carboxypeptidase
MIAKVIQDCLRRIAICFVANDWKKLRIKLIDEYRCYHRDNEWHPPVVAQKILISAEDHRFFNHPGFDVFAICRAICRRALFGAVEGASTIDQQVVRVLTGRYERTISRKLQEILLATLLTLIVPKKDLPGIYIRIGYYGWRMNNYKDACLRLQFTSSSMSLIEAANLVARLKYPEPRQYSAVRSSQIRKRVRHLLALHAVHASTAVYRGLKLEVTNATI